MAAKRGKKQARRKDEPRIPGLVWLLSGLVIGGAVAVAVWLKNPTAVNDLLPHPNPAAKPRLASSAGDGSKVPEGNPPAASTSVSKATDAGAAAVKKPRYDFYTLLPEREVVIPDEELSAQVKAEQSANLAAKQQAALVAAASTADNAAASTLVTPGAASVATTNGAASVTPANGTVAPHDAGASTSASTASGHASTTASVSANVTTPTIKANIPVPASQLKSGQYLLQAGAFRSTQQADDLKARIAMLGLVGRVETVQTPAGTMHRVRLGPYATASELEAAKEKLGGNGLPAVAIRVK